MTVEFFYESCLKFCKELWILFKISPRIPNKNSIEKQMSLKNVLQNVFQLYIDRLKMKEKMYTVFPRIISAETILF